MQQHNLELESSDSDCEEPTVSSTNEVFLKPAYTKFNECFWLVFKLKTINECDSNFSITKSSKRFERSHSNVQMINMEIFGSKLKLSLRKHYRVGFLQFDQTTQRSIMSQSLRTEIIARGSDLFQNGAFVANSGGRSMNSMWFKRRLANGDEVDCSWFFYSPINEAVYYFCCLLFPNFISNSQSSFESPGGFTDWRNLLYGKKLNVE
ncbi:zinc finger MYM-type protein 5-like [Hydra vulgaris]|uniref:Zinc finger MYM-type protein 5-like n=1 Tax=Hydra vulgaris TaxID=6087 RepID=A0ABM4CLY5_HYDVU